MTLAAKVRSQRVCTSVTKLAIATWITRSSAEGADVRASVNARGFFEFPRDLLKELPQQKDSQGVGDPGDDEGLVRIHPPKRSDLQVQRNGQHLKRNDHRAEEDSK